ncbi:MAG: phage/plasmid primase, P4 family [Acidobacteriota bacterium]
MNGDTLRAREFIAAVFDGVDGFLNVRTLPPVEQTFVPIADFDALEAFVKSRRDRNAYIGAAARVSNTDGSLAGCGALPAVFADLDFKDFANEGEARRQLEASPLAPSVVIQSGGGLQPWWLLREPIDLQREAPNAKSLLRRIAISLHADMAAAEPARILRLPNTQNFKYLPPRRVKVEVFEPGRRYNLGDFEEYLPEAPRPVPPSRSVSSPTDPDRLVHRARRYLAETPGAIQGQGGDHHTFVVACRLVRDFALDDTTALDILRDWNQRCVPLWSDRELETKISNARDYGNGSIGTKLNESQCPALTTEAATHTPAPPSAPRTFNFSDTGNAEYFAWRHGADVRFDFRRDRPLVWQQNRWRPDGDAEIRRLAKSAMRQRFRDAAALEDPEARRRAAKWATDSESRTRLDSLLYLAQAEPPIADPGDAWDKQSTLLNASNSTVDLTTGVSRPSRREDRITLCTGAEYHPSARSELWDHALRSILVDDDVIDFFQVAVGYSATGDTSRDCWFLGCGSGRNGKGTLFQPIRHALGDYALELPGSVFDLRSERSPYELAYLPGKRFVTSSEAGDTLRLHHDRIKQLSGGDSMSAANKYEKAFEFEPDCKLWLACNKRPRVTDDTAAFWARVFLIPFTQSFVGREDRTLRPALVQDRRHQAAVLAWIVRGAVRYHAEGLEPPASIRAATAAYREDSDPLAAFLEETCDLEPTAEVGAKELYEHYARWADAQHFSPKERLSATMFGRLISGRFEREHTRSGKVYKGLARRHV